MKRTIVIPSKLKPQLVRKRTIVNVQPTQFTPTPSAAIQPPIARQPPTIQPAPPVNRPKAAAPQPAQPAQVEIVRHSSAVKQPRYRTPRIRNGVTYVSQDVTPESVEKVQAIQGRGRGRILVIIGNGPSILEVPLEQLRVSPLIDIMSINKPDPRVWPSAYWAFCDTSQYLRHRELWTEYRGTLITSTSIAQQKPNSMQVKNLGDYGFSRSLNIGYHIGRSTVYAAMQIAYWLAHEHVYIFGVDMDPNGINGQLHFYGTNPDVEPEVRKTRFEAEASYYDQAATVLTPEERSKYTFCSDYNTWGFVEKYGRLSHKIAVDEILQHAARLAHG